MIIETISGFILGDVYSNLKSEFKKRIDKKKLQTALETLQKRLEIQKEALNLDEEIDWDGFWNYLRSDFIDYILPYFIDINIDKLARLNSIYSRAYHFSRTNTNPLSDKQKQLVDNYIRNLLSIIEEFFIKKLDLSQKLIINNIINTISKKNDEMKEDILRKIDESSKHELEEIKKIIFDYNSFAYYLKQETDKERDYDRIKFHYTYAKLGFYGRDIELIYLYKFMDCDEKSLFTAITGHGGSGKSKLAYEFCKMHKHDKNWDVYFLSSDFFRNKNFDETIYCKNLLLFIDYVGSNEKEVAKFIATANDINKDYKLRIVLLERQGIELIDNKKVMPLWYQHMIDSNNRNIINFIDIHLTFFTNSN